MIVNVNGDPGMDEVGFIDLVRQTLHRGRGSSAEYAMQLVLKNVRNSDSVDLQLSDTAVSLHLPGSLPTTISTMLPIRSDEATARFAKKQRTLLVRGPASVPMPVWEHASGATCVRATACGLGRGTVEVRLPLPASASGSSHASATCYVLVSKWGLPATLADRGLASPGYTWCHVCPMMPSAMVTISIETAAWHWDCPDAVVTLGVLRRGEEPPFIEPGLEQLGVDFRVVSAEVVAATCCEAPGAASAPASTSASAAASTAASAASPGAESAVGWAVEFVPEEALLPSAAMRDACQLYKRAFRTVDGFERSREYSLGAGRRAPPTWRDEATPEGIVDQNCVSLTYGEAEFVPFYLMMSRLGVREGDVVVDIGSGTGRMVLGTALGFPHAAEVRGIEIVPDLHAGAVEVHAWLAAKIASRSTEAPAVTAEVTTEAPAVTAVTAVTAEAPAVTAEVTADAAADAAPTMAPVRLIEGDILEAHWADADLVLATSLCFPSALLAKVLRRALGLRRGARFVCMQSDLLEAHADADVADAFDFMMKDDVDEETAEEQAAEEQAAEGEAEKHAPPARAPHSSGLASAFRRVPMDTASDTDPPHRLVTAMSWGEASFYVYERV